MITDFFPAGFTPRPIQAELLEKVEAAFEAGHRFVILEAPPGVGKTHLAATLAARYGSTWFCTVTKQLQAQYRSLFPWIRELKGRATFTCVFDSHFDPHDPPLEPPTNCKVGATKHRDEFKCPPKSCPYRVAKAEAVLASATICNYYSYLYNVGFGPFSIAALEDYEPEEDGPDKERWYRRLLICDEAHEIEATICEHSTVTVDTTKLAHWFADAPVFDAGDIESCFEWLRVFLIAAAALLRENEEYPTLVEDEVAEIEGFCAKAQFALEHDDENWIADPLPDPKKKGFVLQPLTVAGMTDPLFRYGKRVLLMSATVLDAQLMADSLGIDDYVFISAPCPFPVKNREIVVSGLNMTKAHRATSWPKMVDQVAMILAGHADEKGLILTPSNEMLNYILEGLPKELADRLILARGQDRMECYQRHLDAEEPTVLAASGFWEGADLKDEFSRFQILPALPRPYWSRQVEARTAIDKTWYRLKTYQQLIQGCGRSVRSESDFSATYCLDGELKREAFRSDTLLPQWFREALIFA